MLTLYHIEVKDLRKAICNNQTAYHRTFVMQYKHGIAVASTRAELYRSVVTKLCFILSKIPLILLISYLSVEESNKLFIGLLRRPKSRVTFV